MRKPDRIEDASTARRAAEPPVRTQATKGDVSGEPSSDSRVHVDLDELLDALEWVSAGETAAVDAEVYIRRIDGQILWCGEGVDEEPPEDIEDGTVYIAVPRLREFDLGRSLAVRFVEEHLPRSLEEVENYFRRRGAYSRLKSLLERVGQLEAWYRYEKAAKEEALKEWCAENGFHAGG